VLGIVEHALMIRLAATASDHFGHRRAYIIPVSLLM